MDGRFSALCRVSVYLNMFINDCYSKSHRNATKTQAHKEPGGVTKTIDYSKRLIFIPGVHGGGNGKDASVVFMYGYG